MARQGSMNFEMNGFRIHYGEFSGVWWAASLTSMLVVERFSSKNAAIAWVEKYKA